MLVGEEMKQLISIRHLNTPLGVMIAGATDNGLCLLEYHDRALLSKELEDLQVLLNAEVAEQDHPIISMANSQLHEYFAGTRKSFTVPLLTPGTDFQQKVWHGLLDIPFGETRSYLVQAEILGDVKSIRAVAHANGCNRISIIIPCHRVIGKNGSLTGYGGGIERKRFLLLHESHYSVSTRHDLFSGLLNVP